MMDQFRPRDEQDPVREIERGVESAKRWMEKMFRGKGAWLIVLIVVLGYLLSGFYRVGPGEKGVVLLFGKVWAITEPGPRYRLPRPFMDHAIVDVARVRRAEIGYRSSGRHTKNLAAEALMLTGDENIVDVQLLVQYEVRDPEKFLFGAVQPEMALRAAAEVALRGIVGENTIDFTMTKGRMEVQEKVGAYLQKLLDAYHTGLEVTQARLLAVDPPAKVKEAFHDVVRAWEDRERLIREAEGYREDVVPKARGRGREEVRKAEAFKAQRVIRAQGDAQRFKEVLAAYSKAPPVTRERLYLETMERVLPGVRKVVLEASGSPVLPLLPLGSMGGHETKPPAAVKKQTEK
jgi:membrane protease subunit HflK